MFRVVVQVLSVEAFLKRRHMELIMRQRQEEEAREHAREREASRWETGGSVGGGDVGSGGGGGRGGGAVQTQSKSTLPPALSLLTISLNLLSIFVVISAVRAYLHPLVRTFVHPGRGKPRAERARLTAP